MASVSLKTNSGDFVSEVTVPDFVIPPEVVVWGTRVFVKDTDGTYREGVMAFAQAVLPSFPGQTIMEFRTQEDPFIPMPRNWPSSLS